MRFNKQYCFRPTDRKFNDFDCCVNKLQYDDFKQKISVLQDPAKLPVNKKLILC